MVRSEMVGLRGKTNFPPTSLAAYGTSNPTSYSNPCSFRVWIFIPQLAADPFTMVLSPSMKLSPLCGWSLLSGGRSWETGPTLQRTRERHGRDDRWWGDPSFPTPEFRPFKESLKGSESRHLFLGGKVETCPLLRGRKKKTSKIIALAALNLKGKSIWKVIVQTFPISAIIWSFEKRGRLQASK